MSDMDEIRRFLDGLIKERGLKMDALSKAIGRNQTYIQQYLRYGEPKRLPEDVRHRLAAELKIDERSLRTRALNRADGHEINAATAVASSTLPPSIPGIQEPDETSLLPIAADIVRFAIEYCRRHGVEHIGAGEIPLLAKRALEAHQANEALLAQVDSLTRFENEQRVEVRTSYESEEAASKRR